MPFPRTSAVTRRSLPQSEMLSSVLMFPFVVGELEAGFRGGNRYEANKKILRSFLSEPNVRLVQTTLRTAELFGELKDSLCKAGTMIPIDDVWIGAMAKEHLAQVVSFDHHFGFMVPLGVDWVNPKQDFNLQSQ